MDVANWVHHTPYILPQGRTTFVDPFQKSEDDEEEEEVEEDVDGGSENGRAAEEHPESVPEEARPVLAPLSEDARTNDCVFYCGGPKAQSI
jgi:radial spoke head protein 4A